MKIPTNHHKHFKGKVCTVITGPINRDFYRENPKRYPEQVYQYFLGVVEELDEYGILLTQVQTARKTYIFYHQMIALAEEVVEVLDEEAVDVLKNPEEIKEYMKQKGMPIPQIPNSPNSPLVDAAALEEINRQLRQTMAVRSEAGGK